MRAVFVIAVVGSSAAVALEKLGTDTLGRCVGAVVAQQLEWSSTVKKTLGTLSLLAK